MTAARWMALATMTVALWQAPGVVRAEVYKCTIGGRTAYQDQPCADTTAAVAGKATGVSGSKEADASARSNSMPPSSDPGTLHRQLLDAREQSARLRTLYERDMEQAKAKAATMSLEQQRQLTKVLHARWDPKLQAAGRREQELSEALGRMCPGGAMLNAQAQPCSK